jgi:hypothetical protein
MTRNEAGRRVVMRISFTTIIAVIMLCSFSFAQDSKPSQNVPATPKAQQTQGQPSEPGQSTPTRVAPGSVIPVQLTKTIDAKKVKTGDEVDAKVTQDLKTQSGQVLMPKDTKIVGHVTEAQSRNKGQKESELGIAFDKAVLKEGGDLSLPASIQAVIAPPSQNPNNANAGGGGTAAPSSMPGGGSPGGRSGMAGAPQQQPGAYPTAGSGEQPNNASNGNSANPQITANTQGVIGLSNYKLSTPGDVTQGSVVSSEKSNVKLESGTLLLLRVHQ